MECVLCGCWSAMEMECVRVLAGCCSDTESGFVCAVGADQATLVLNDCSAATRAILDA